MRTGTSLWMNGIVRSFLVIGFFEMARNNGRNRSKFRTVASSRPWFPFSSLPNGRLVSSQETPKHPTELFKLDRTRPMAPPQPPAAGHFYRPTYPHGIRHGCPHVPQARAPSVRHPQSPSTGPRTEDPSFVVMARTTWYQRRGVCTQLQKPRRCAALDR